MRRTALVFTVLLVFGVGTASAQLYATGHVGPDGPATLYSVDPNTGGATPIGAIGFERCGGLDADANGVLYSTCERTDGSDTGVLVTIDPASGAGTEVGPHGLNSSIGDISFRSDGTLYAFDAANDPEHTLATIDPMSGVGTNVGDTGLSFAGGNGMTFDAADTLYHSQFTGQAGQDLNTLDQGAGTATFVGLIVPGPPSSPNGRINSMDLDPGTGTIYAFINDGTGGAGPQYLATVDPVALTISIVGQTANDVDGIAFAGAPPNVLEIPTLGVPSLVGLAILLVIASGLLLRRRSHHPI